jgi:hypothetical protein
MPRRDKLRLHPGQLVPVELMAQAPNSAWISFSLFIAIGPHVSSRS